jgi:hypothetical protein
VYASSAERFVDFPPKAKLFPFTPSATVQRRPNNTNVKTSPYYQHESAPDLGNAMIIYLLSTLEVEVQRVVAVMNSRSDEREPVEDDGRRRTVTGRKLWELFSRGPKYYGVAYQLPYNIQEYGKDRNIEKSEESQTGGQRELSLSNITRPVIGAG